MRPFKEPYKALYRALQGPLNGPLRGPLSRPQHKAGLKRNYQTCSRFEIAIFISFALKSRFDFPVSNLLFGIKPAYDEACLCGAGTLHTHSAHVATARTASCQCYHKLYKPRDAGFAVGFALGCAVGSSAAVCAASFALTAALSRFVRKPLFQPLWSWHISHSFCPSRHSQNGFLHALHL